MSVEERLEALEKSNKEQEEENATLRAELDYLREAREELDDPPHSEVILKEFKAWNHFSTEVKREIMALDEEATTGDVLELVKSKIDFRLRYLKTLVVDLTQKRVRAFKREVRVFKTRHPDFKIALLLCDSLQKEIEIHYGLKRAEDLSEEQVFDFLTKESMPKSLSTLKTQLKQLQCSTTAISKLPLTTCVREFIADFMELAELAETVALNDDATRAMIPLYGLKSAEEAFYRRRRYR
ncbi:hypothetical protein J8273_1821 [Carpediemonas membranifera]|uniref:Uncharacterized protein n=1 Tax=Carpediemonas membranifera TaxID=201153 RepID=A0A8J6B233_9EUKA|nr:hypothetical protein J8273_1821 [Carpediemonas membranifera]|eukprot:KAG9396780.1 hypothetical protein J8273_1821 [Carpediemonas membranifera]